MPKGFLLLVFLFFAYHSLGQTYLISDGGTVSTCSGYFYDSGGPSNDYSNREDFVITFCSSNSGPITVEFNSFSTRNFDILHIYDGPATGSPEIATLVGNLGSGAGTYTSSGTCLTFYFESNNNWVRPGWEATLSCTDPCAGLPVLTFDPIPNVCEDDAALNLTQASPAGGMYSGTGITTSPEFDPSVAGAGIHTITYTYTDINGCTGSIDQTIEVEPLPTFGYQYTASLTVDAASGSEDLTDFPVLIRVNSAPTADNLRSVSNGGHVENVNGFDIAFLDENYSLLNHQIESYDPVTGEYIAWVRIPLLSCSSPTTIYMAYGNPGISTDPSSSDVWLSSYKGVWHLNSDATDATNTGNDGAESNTLDVAGVIGSGKDFNGSNSYIRFNPLTGMSSNDENQSLSVWAYYNSAPGDVENFFSIQNPGSAVQIGFRGGVVVAWKWGGTILANSGYAPSGGTWHHYVYTFDGTTHHLYIDGVEVGSSTVTPQVLIPTEGNLGRYNNGEYFDGWLDEARYSISTLSPGWIATEYSNQFNPSGFISFGSERVTTDTISVGICITSYPLEEGYPAGGVYSGTGVSGSTFNPSVAGEGTHTLTYTYNAGVCTGAVDSKVFIVTPVPSAPAASDVACCVSNILDLTASGTNLIWYSDAGLTTKVGFGSPFATGQTTTGNYTYYVTQTVNGCEGPATEVTLSILDVTLGGTLISTSPVCSGEYTFAELTGYSGNVIEYDFSTVSSTGPWTTINHPYDTLTYGPVSSDIWLRVLVQAGTCPQTYSSVAAVVNSIPSVAPTAASSDRNNICPNDGNIVLSYSGGALGTGATAEWYSDDTFSTNVGTGNNLSVPTPAGSTTYYVRFEGDCNITSAQSVDVIIEDITPPTFTAPADITIYSNASCAYDTSVVATGDVIDEADNCGVGQATHSDLFDDTDPCSITITRTWSLVDDAGNPAADQVQTIIIEDNIDPTASSPAPINVECSGDVPAPDITVVTDEADNCTVVPTVTWVEDFSDGNTCPEEITRSYRVEDDCGNAILVYQTITVEDITPPASICQNISIQLDDTGNATITAMDIDNGSSDNCAIESMWLDRYDFNCTDLGPNTVYLTVRDACGLESTCSATVTVQDNLGPDITCPADFSEFVDIYDDFIIPDYTSLIVVSDNCNPSPVLTQDPVSGTVVHGVGTIHTISITADDGYGNDSQCTFDITLIDSLILSIICPPDQNEFVDDNCDFVIPDYTGLATTTGAVSVSQEPAAGTVISGYGTVQPITLTAMDGGGNTEQCSFDVILIDNISPGITGCPADINTTADTSYCGTEVSWIEPAVSDNCPGVILTSTHNPGDFFPVGTTTVTYTATDASGLTAICSFDVNVAEALPPVISGPTEVCTTVQETYSVADPGTHTFSWVVTNGTISGSATDPVVSIEWSGTAQGCVEVTITSASGCSITNSINVNKYETPSVGIINSSNSLIRR